MLAFAVGLSDRELLARIDALAGKERAATAELVAHLVALEMRPSLYVAQGYGSLFDYCTQVLRLSEDAACNRIEAARAGREFPIILDLLASGSLTLTSVRRLRKHLTPENHEAVLARAAHRRKDQIEALVAELAPQPDVPASVRKLPIRQPAASSSPDAGHQLLRDLLEDGAHPAPVPAPASNLPFEGAAANPHPLPRPIVQALAPERYRVQFTIGQETYDKLRRIQALLCREVPSGDAGLIFEQFIDVLLEKVEKAKLGKTVVRRSGASGVPRPAYGIRIRSGTDRTTSDQREQASSGSTAATPFSSTSQVQRKAASSRYIPNDVKRAVWYRDAGQCAFVSNTGHRCTERSFLELHHIHPHALGGPAAAGNISLRCRRHNEHESELVFGPRLVHTTTGSG